MHIPLLRGRFLSDGDSNSSQQVAVIDTGFAEKYFCGQNPIGKHITVLDFQDDPAERTWIPLVVVGVVGHVNQFGLADDATHPLQAQIYRSFGQGSNVWLMNFAQGITAYVRAQSSLKPEAFFASMREKLLMYDSEMIVSENELEREVVSRSIASQRFSLLLLGIFACFAVLLASVGIYGVLSYLVGRRTQEIGVRMALGAQRAEVLRMVLREGAQLTLIGAGVGVVAALGLTQLMSNMLFGVKPGDPITFGVVVVVLCGIALLACYLPARRATRVDPMVALRYE
jgi:predicted permease